jgi:hypothetical protein
MIDKTIAVALMVFDTGIAWYVMHQIAQHM